MDLTPFLRRAAREGDMDEQIRRDERRTLASDDGVDEVDEDALRDSRGGGIEPDERKAPRRGPK